MKKILLITLVITTILSCKEDETQTPDPGTLNLTFNNTITLGDSYTNTSGESYTINELKYIISNITLTRKDGSVVVYPPDQSYFVINEADANSLTVQLDDIEAGAYSSATFGFGVDPTKYPIESGTLNFIPTAEEAGMLWTWSAGYKFIKLEGDYTAEDATEEAPFIIHVGSHGANLDNYKEITVPLGDDIANTDFNIAEGLNASQTINFDISKIFDGPNTIRIQDNPDIQVDPVNAPLIATNISTAFFVPQG
jgi:hypothetical protein